MSDLAGIHKQCTAEGGLTRVTLGALREELGYRKLGSGVLTEIADELAETDLGYFPRETLDSRCNTVPRKEQGVWVYVRDGSTRAAVLDAVLDPGRVNVRRILDGLAEGNLGALSPQERLDRISAIVNAKEDA